MFLLYRPVSEDQEKGDGDAESLFGEIGVSFNKVLFVILRLLGIIGCVTVKEIAHSSIRE